MKKLLTVLFPRKAEADRQYLETENEINQVKSEKKQSKRLVIANSSTPPPILSHSTLQSFPIHTYLPYPNSHSHLSPSALQYPKTRRFFGRKELTNLKKTTLATYYKLMSEYKIPAKRLISPNTISAMVIAFCKFIRLFIVRIVEVCICCSISISGS